MKTVSVDRVMGGVSDRLVMGILIGLFLGSIGASLFFHSNIDVLRLAGWFDSVLQNTGTEMFGAFLTFLLIEVLLRKRREAEESTRTEAKRLEELIRQMGSTVNDVTLAATEQLRVLGKLADGTLRGANLVGSNLQRADLVRTNLERANLVRSNLQETNLVRVNLQGADLFGANLQGAHLVRAELQGANLWEANLKGADLGFANLEGATMVRASLEGSDLWEAYLKGADLGFASLEGAVMVRANLEEAILVRARGWTVEQLRLAETFRGAVLPDETKLPGDDTWREAFDRWCQEQENQEDNEGKKNGAD